VTTTTPREAREAIAGASSGSTGGDLAELRRAHSVTKADWSKAAIARVHAPSGAVPSGFERVVPTLEDAYWS
jgi:hypothetical protein